MVRAPAGQADAGRSSRRSGAGVAPGQSMTASAPNVVPTHGVAWLQSSVIDPPAWTEAFSAPNEQSVSVVPPPDALDAPAATRPQHHRAGERDRVSPQPYRPPIAHVNLASA